MRILALALAWLLAHVPHVGHHVGLGTRFDLPASDPHNRGGHACRYPSRRVGQSAESRHLERLGHVVALWTAPCWAVLTVCVPRTGLCESATVADRGPVHAAIDLFSPLSRALRHNGREIVTWDVQP